MDSVKPVQADQIRALLDVVLIVNEIHALRPYYSYGEDEIEKDFSHKEHPFPDYISTNKKKKRKIQQEDDIEDTREAEEGETAEERKNRLAQEKRNCQAMAQFMSPEEVDFYRTHKRVNRSTYQKIQELQIATCVWIIDALIGSAESCCELFCGVFGKERLLIEEKRYKESSDLFTHDQVPLEIESRRQYTLLVRQFTHLLVRILRSITRVRDMLINKLKYCVSVLGKEESESNNFSNLYFARRVPPNNVFYNLAQEMQHDIMRSIPYVTIVSSSRRNGLCAVMIEDPRLKRFEQSQENNFSTGPCLASEDETVYFRMNSALFTVYSIEKAYSEQKEPREIMRSNLRLTDSDIQELFPGREEHAKYLIEPVDIDKEIHESRSYARCPVPYHDVIFDLLNHVITQWKALFKKVDSEGDCWYRDSTTRQSALHRRYISDMFNFAMTTRMPFARIIVDCYNSPQSSIAQFSHMVSEHKHIRFPNPNTRTEDSDRLLFLRGLELNQVAIKTFKAMQDMAFAYIEGLNTSTETLKVIGNRLRINEWPSEMVVHKVVRAYINSAKNKSYVLTEIWMRLATRYSVTRKKSRWHKAKLAMSDNITSIFPTLHMTEAYPPMMAARRFERYKLWDEVKNFIDDAAKALMEQEQIDDKDLVSKKDPVSEKEPVSDDE